MVGHGREPAAGRGVLEGAFALLEELARGGETGLSRLAARAGLPKATAHRLLNQLVAVGAVQRHVRPAIVMDAGVPAGEVRRPFRVGSLARQRLAVCRPLFFWGTT